MTYRVYHRDAPTFFDTEPNILAAFPHGWTHVATVTADSGNLEEVFFLTNSLDDVWTKNVGVMPITDAAKVGHVRSTSVGDVVVDEAGKRYAVQGVGWKEF
jgi:hypothetical protein